MNCFKIHFPAWPCALMLLTIATGCSSVMTIKPPAKPFAEYPPAERLNLRVGLILTDELCTATAEATALGSSRFIVPFGGGVCLNSEEMCRRLFREVHVLRDPGAGVSDVDVLITPTVTYSRYLNAAGLIVIQMEWSATRPGGQPVWAGTVTGEGKARVLMRNDEDTLEWALEDLFRKSFDAIRSAPELRQYAQNQPAARI